VVAELDPSTRSVVDQVHAEARDDYERLLASARQFLEAAGGSKVDASVAFTSMMLAQPSWNDVMMVASVLGVALMEIAGASDA
jgi:hypothetical protein